MFRKCIAGFLVALLRVGYYVDRCHEGFLNTCALGLRLTIIHQYLLLSELFRSEQQFLDLLQAVAMKTTLAPSVLVPNHSANATCKISTTAVAPVTQL